MKAQIAGICVILSILAGVKAETVSAIGSQTITTTTCSVNSVGFTSTGPGSTCVGRSSNLAIVSNANIVVSGGPTTWTVSISASAPGATTITINCTSSDGSSATSSFSVTTNVAGSPGSAGPCNVSCGGGVLTQSCLPSCATCSGPLTACNTAICAVYYVRTRLRIDTAAMDAAGRSALTTNFVNDVAAVLSIPPQWIVILLLKVGTTTEITFSINPDPNIYGGPTVSQTLSNSLATSYQIAVQNANSPLYNRTVTGQTDASFLYIGATLPGSGDKPGDWDLNTLTDFNVWNPIKYVAIAVAAIILGLLILLLVYCCKRGCCWCCRNKGGDDGGYNRTSPVVSRGNSKSRLNVEISSPSLVSTTYVEMQPKPPPSSPSVAERGGQTLAPVSFEEEAEWQEVWDPNYKRNYFWNKRTKESRWVSPFVA